jgi:hypothetical protein
LLLLVDDMYWSNSVFGKHIRDVPILVCNRGLVVISWLTAFFGRSLRVSMGVSTASVSMAMSMSMTVEKE